MRNQRALAAACTAVAMLGFAVPVAVADGTGNGGNFTIHGHFKDNGDPGRDPGRGDDFGRSDENGSGARSDDSGDRGDDLHRGDDSGDHNEDFGDSEDDFGGRGNGGPRNIVATPGVLPAGGRLTVTADGCHGGTMSSRAFPTTQFDDFRDDTASGTINVDRDAPPGRYDIRIRCENRTLVRPAAFTVLGGVQGGVGGSRSSGATPADMAVGAGLVTLGVVGGGAFWLRRRNEKRG
ncbi:hypothetical protein ACWC2T_18785 [Streptomyces sp. NPDC001393]